MTKLNDFYVVQVSSKSYNPPKYGFSSGVGVSQDNPTFTTAHAALTYAAGIDPDEYLVFVQALERGEGESGEDVHKRYLDDELIVYRIFQTPELQSRLQNLTGMPATERLLYEVKAFIEGWILSSTGITADVRPYFVTEGRSRYQLRFDLVSCRSKYSQY